ncbi:MAG: LysR family transcriptional regulator [unclassified Hahellaceae]|nr:LysR family transcriptional regulator [Hahellaceae bacterium]|tara:strand:- start:22613 stop:23503 length:891 start_codon:yes stop_codon:yes gene_type:complete
MDKFLEMQTFTAVVEAGSFVGAADGLAMSKAAVSRYIADLEARLGLRLLHRTTRRLSLTEEGDVFYYRCRELLASLDAAETELSSRRGEASGLLRVNAPLTFGISHLAPLWGDFLEQNPKVRIDINLSDRMVDLVEEGYDIAIRIAALSNSTLISRRFASTRIVMCASPGYLEAFGEPQTPADLTSHRIIAYSYSAKGDEWHFDGPGGPVSVRTRPAMSSNNGDTCRALALAGQGVTLQPDFLVGRDIADGSLVEVLPEYHAAELGIYAMYPTRKHVAPKVTALIDFLQEAFQRAG